MDSRYQRNIYQIIHKYRQIVHKYINLQIEERRESKEEQTPESTSRLPAAEKGQKAEDGGARTGDTRVGDARRGRSTRVRTGVAAVAYPPGTSASGRRRQRSDKGARARPSRGVALGRWQRSGEGARADADTCKIRQPRIRLRDGPKSLG